MFKRKELLLISGVVIVGTVLRLVRLGEIPPGPYLDEVLYGLDAKSILETGKDVYGRTFPIAFQSVGYIPPVYNYLLVPIVAIFGLSAFSIRLLTAISGILTILFTYLVAKELTVSKKSYIGFTAAAVVALSIWNIHFSRVAFIASFGMIFVLVGIYLFLKSRKKQFYLVVSSAFFGIATQIHHDGYKLISPLIFAAFLALDLKLIKNYKKNVIAGVLLVWGLVISVNWISLHYFNAAFRANALINSNPKGILTEYLKTFSPQFLFTNGDHDLMRNPIQAGEVSLVLAPFLFLGFTQLRRLTNTGRAALIIWLLIAPIPSAFAGYGDHALRNSLLIVPLALIIALGFVWLIEKSQKSRAFLYVLLLAILTFTLEHFWGLNYYFLNYTKYHPNLWGENSRAAVAFANQKANEYDKIIFTDSYNSMLSFWAFGSNVPAKDLQNAILLPELYNGVPVKRIGKFFFVPMEEEKGKDWYLKMGNKILIIDTHFYLEGGNFSAFDKEGRDDFQYSEIN